MMLEEQQDREAAEARARQEAHRARIADLIARKGAGAMAAAASAENHKAKTPQNDLGATNEPRTALPNKERRARAAKYRNLVLEVVKEFPNIRGKEAAVKVGISHNSAKAYLAWLTKHEYIHGISGNGYVAGKRP